MIAVNILLAFSLGVFAFLVGVDVGVKIMEDDDEGDEK